MARAYLLIIVLGVLGGVGFGAWKYYTDTQQRIQTLAENNAKLETALETSEASIATLKADNARLNTLTDQLNSDLNKSEAYGDELRATLNKHNLTHLANKKPGLIENRMQGKTDELWKDLESITGSTPTD